MKFLTLLRWWVLILLATLAAGLALSWAPDRHVDSLTARWAPDPSPIHPLARHAITDCP